MNSYAIIDMQFGSTGKGLLAGFLAKRMNPDTVVCAFGPNAGHTFIESDGTRHVNVMVPMGALSPNIERVLIGPGAIVHPDILISELARYAHRPFKLAIHENAVCVNDKHREIEGQSKGTVTTGSTRKGTGAAIASKVMREMTTARYALQNTALESSVVDVKEYNSLMDKAIVLQIEGAQGFSLSHHHGFYPYVTSRDCTIWQLMADCAVPGNLMPRVYGTCRTFPIRVNNRGYSSGPCYHDQKELAWESLNLPAELTTVTKLPRRIFTFSHEQIKQAVRMNGVNAVFLNFCNYLTDPQKITDFRKFFGGLGPRIWWEGWGPTESDVRQVIT